MSDKNDTMKKFGMSLNLWIYGRVKEFADENGMSIRAAIRFMINQFFKNRL
jgi:hypothetical protein